MLKRRVDLLQPLAAALSDAAAKIVECPQCGNPPVPGRLTCSECGTSQEAAYRIANILTQDVEQLRSRLDALRTSRE